MFHTETLKEREIILVNNFANCLFGTELLGRIEARTFVLSSPVTATRTSVF